MEELPGAPVGTDRSRVALGRSKKQMPGQKDRTVGFYREMLKCMEPFEHIGEWGYLAMADNMLGIMSLNRGNAPFALDYYYRAESICKQYSLPDIEWVVQMNMGALFLSVGSPDEAIKHYDIAYRYILDHKEMPSFRQSLTAVAVGLGRSYMQKDDMTTASRYEAIIEVQCTPYLTKDEEINVYCFLALYLPQGLSGTEDCLP